MNFVELFIAWTLGFGMFALIFQGTIRAFIKGFLGYEMSDRQRGMVLIGMIVIISILTFMSNISTKETEKNTAPTPVSQPQKPEQKVIELI
jgi:hypothetical protein